MINAETWLVRRFETIFDERFCHITCLVIVAHLFWHDAERMEPSYLSHNMAHLHQEPPQKRHDLLPDKLAQGS
jgi:hypothetical protein